MNDDRSKPTTVRDSASPLSLSVTQHVSKNSSSMSSSQSSISTDIVNDSGIIKGTKKTTTFARPVPRVLQNFVFAWLDANTEQCIDFISDVKDEKVFLIVTGSLGRDLVSDIEIHTCTQLNSIYVLLDDKLLTYEQRAQATWKVKGAYAQLESICETLKIELRHCDHSMISMSFSGIDPLFMYAQLFKESLL
ncbi:unnamed protein product [Rotaria magnacalcarata]|uniref:Uncharacterized protein n=2 Tax=Rotaria magnacalcarata TaxID=392030 RepID=A0A815X3E9_9BILA|nr:unnamed protein product [Rotaria magnacalcarata]CAF1657730.1 unnamed protein product [Rotaria magnacalcarata]CAF2011617.1 unnamed protein product [Rotaria magnacalcarata]CAF3924749.1 unnamed protein product [Rotaria magnacalcarata]CAF4638963.1 unnamed protein product [Rotaria magnacalcarata]